MRIYMIHISLDIYTDSADKFEEINLGRFKNFKYSGD